VEGIPELLDLVVAVLQIIVVLFLAYGAYLAICKTEGLPIADELVSVFRAPARGLWMGSIALADGKPSSRGVL
jgi:hypothetical protein